MRVGVALAAAQHEYGHLLQIPGSFFGRYQHSTSSIAHNTTIEQVQRISNHAGVQHILYCDGFAVHGEGVKAGMPACYDGNLGKLFRGSSVLVHMPAGCHCVSADKRVAVGRLVGCFGNSCGPSSSSKHTAA